MPSGLKIWIRGIVQGVGFRPFVYTLAERHKLTGWVKNTSGGVEIEICGPNRSLEAFLQHLRAEMPPLARIDEFHSRPVSHNGYTTFSILESRSEEGAFLPVSPDVALCPDCRRELLNPSDRRYRYPFINCTHCGPRFSIVKNIPYDRPNTTMADFAMCPNCQAEYDDPHDRRFHAQPIACPACGPHLFFETGGQKITEREEALQIARAWLKAGKILAIKGLGGFHLACDAGNAGAVDELRRRKRRSDKPFALMTYHLEIIEKHCLVSEKSAQLLSSRQAPVVLLPRKANSSISPAVAPGQTTLGFMLPYTPLHLLLTEPEPGFPEVLVMTSGNLSEEPIAFRDEDARRLLAPLADGFLLHDRPIHMRVDDSVVRDFEEQAYFIRRSRGFAPDPVMLPFASPPLLATGPELKNTFCLARDRYAFISHHIGDMENYETLQSFEEGIRHFECLFHIKPQRIACDLHPNYLATRYAKQRAQEEQIPLVEIQHHHAHLAACLADNGWNSPEPVIGLCFDGTGIGVDGAIWGSEVLVGGYEGYQRRFHLAYTPLPGGDAAVRKPARMALAHLWSAGIDWDPDYAPCSTICAQDRLILKTQIEKGINAPNTSSMGRLFDAASSLMGIRQTATYEGQAAIEMEALADPAELGHYPFAINGEIADPAPLWYELIKDRQAGCSTPLMAARFHNSIARLAVDLCQQIRSESGNAAVALSGGVWQNQFLLERALAGLSAAGFRVLIHRQTPPNDGCIALGQAAIACRMNS